VYNGDKLTHFTVSKMDITKFPWGPLGDIAPQPFRYGFVVYAVRQMIY